MNELSVQVSYKKQVTLGIIGVIILLLAIEAIANVWWAMQIHCEFEENEIFQNFDEVEKRQLCLDFYNIQTAGDELIPNQSTDSITINSLGFRGAEFSAIKPSDTYRIFMVGGSTMFGAGATSDETTIPGYLQRFLNEKDFGFDIQVINSGIQGADSNTESNLIKQKLVRLSPDLIIIYDGMNDLRAGNPPNELKENWETICEFGKENDFDVIISLHPIAGFGNKVLTKQELKYTQTEEYYNKKSLIESLPVYQDYAKNLAKIKNCTKTIDLRGIFDDEVGPIYWDDVHVSDLGNSIVANSLNSMIFPIISKNHEFSTFEYKKDAEKTPSLIYDGREIIVSVELFPTNELVNKKLRITTHDNTNNEIIQNVTYFLSISKDNENLLRKYFFAEDGVLSIDIQPDNNPLIKVIGEKQYDHDAYVMPGTKYNPDTKYNPGQSGEYLTSTTQLQITGPIFDTEGIYILDIELRTVDSRDNWTFSLSGFNSQVTIGKHMVLKDSGEKNKSLFQTEDLLRKIFSYYKTPMLLNEIFN